MNQPGCANIRVPLDRSTRRRARNADLRLLAEVSVPDGAGRPLVSSATVTLKRR